jgi:gliding motility-associated-like protein
MKNILLILSFLISTFSFSQQNSLTFNFTGQPQQFVVPPCVFEVCATVRGARGGGPNAGNGATITTCFPVTPGETLYLYVGGMGSAGNTLDMPATNTSAGWNGGGIGHLANNNVQTHHSFGGGGSSDIRIGGNDLSNRTVVAAGGGGSGGGSNTVCGGNGGCVTGTNGCNTFGAGGGGGTQTNGGNGGAPWAGTPPGGQAGSLGQGGNGGPWQTASGGGGGGGLFGGGGGGNDGCCTGANGGGGGGGGSSLVPVGGTCVAGNHNNHGQIILSWINGSVGPPMTISNSGPYCTGSDIELFASNNTATFYNWFGPNGFTSTIQNPVIPGNMVNSLSSGTYYLHYEENGCEDTISINVVVNDPVLPQFNQYTSYCQNAQIPTLPTNALNNSPLTNNSITGTWSPIINNQQTTTYFFSPDPNQCALNSTMQITIIPNIIPEFTQLGPFCINSQLDPLPTTSNNNITGNWSPNINNQDTTTYTFTPNPSECAFNTQMTINIWPLVQPTFNQVAAICQDDNLNQLPTVSLPTILGEITGTWSPQINNQNTTTYTFTPNPNQCSLNSQMTIEVWNRPLPTFIMNQTVGCSPLQVFFENTTGFSNPTSCQWNMGNGNIINSCGTFVSSTYTLPGCYDVNLTMTYPGNCTNTYTEIQAICVEDNPIANFSANPIQTQINQPVIFNNLSIGSVNYQWTFGDLSGTFNTLNTTHIYQSPGLYIVNLVAYSDFGCTDTNSQVILIEEPLIYYIPNSFTPDNDKFNQTFNPIITQGIDIYNYQLIIFNRWGEIIFESNDPNVGWNGTYNEKIVQDGTYIWKIKFKHKNKDKKEEIYGTVNVIK